MNWTKSLHVAAISGLVLEGVTLYLYFPDRGIGGSAEWSTRSAHVSTSSSPLALAWSMFNVALYLVLMIRIPDVQMGDAPPWWRRLLAGAIDFVFFVLTIAPIIALVDLELEARRTGQFVWHFQRNYAVTTDFSVGVPSVVIGLTCSFLYFAFPLTRGTQTVGCFLMRTKVTPPFGDEGVFTWRAAALRIWLVMRNIGGPWRWLRPKRDGYGNTSYDIESNTRVVSVRYGNS